MLSPVTFSGAGVSLRCLAAGEGPLVVMAPSLGRGASDFLHLAGRVADAGFRVVAVNPRGIDGSVGPQDTLTLHDYAADLAMVIEEMGGGPAVAVGHAFGNRVVRCLAAGRPELVQSVVLLACGGQVHPEPDAAAVFQKCFQPELPTEERLAAIATCFFAPGNDASVWLDGWWPGAAAAQRRAVEATPPAEWRHAGSAPLLIVQAMEDRMAPPQNAYTLKSELGGRVTLIELDGAGHAMLPEQPEKIAAAVLEYLGRQG
jgi:pimeloyl-ACP methyl ester carboxylesterase